MTTNSMCVLVSMPRATFVTLVSMSRAMVTSRLLCSTMTTCHSPSHSPESSWNTVLLTI